MHTQTAAELLEQKKAKVSMSEHNNWRRQSSSRPRLVPAATVGELPSPTVGCSSNSRGSSSKLRSLTNDIEEEKKKDKRKKKKKGNADQKAQNASFSNKGVTCLMRYGIAAGPVTAGVLQGKTPMFDIWGKTVNLGSRMESTGQPGRIQVCFLEG